MSKACSSVSPAAYLGWMEFPRLIRAQLLELLERAYESPQSEDCDCRKVKTVLPVLLYPPEPRTEPVIVQASRSLVNSRYQ